jgi:hypothetical protein
VTLLASREKVGKSTLMGQAVAALAAAPSDFFEEPIAAPVKSLWIGIDEPLGDIVRRLDRYQLNAAGLSDKVAIRTARPEALDLVRWIQEEEFRLVVLDHLTAYAAGRVEDTNKAMHYLPIMRELSDVARESRVGLVVLHHAAKSGGYRDSTAIGAGVDAIVLMTPELNELGEEKEGSDGLKRHFVCKGRIPMVNRFTTEYLGGYQVVVRSNLPLDQQILRYIGANPHCSGRDIRAAVGGRHAAVLEVLSQLATNQLIRDEGRHGRAKWVTVLAVPGPQPGTGGNQSWGPREPSGSP